ncbi:Protein of unknown function [Gryllus bimaculatus]|nr:Protein of unknown function [Gryllus bimaculatus]
MCGDEIAESREVKVSKAEIRNIEAKVIRPGDWFLGKERLMKSRGRKVAENGKEKKLIWREEWIKKATGLSKGKERQQQLRQ